MCPMSRMQLVLIDEEVEDGEVDEAWREGTRGRW